MPRLVTPIAEELAVPKGYIVADVHISNPGPAFDDYRVKAAATVDAFGGRFLVGDGEITQLEGDEPAGRIVIVEFESPERAMEWYHSPAYQAILPARLKNARAQLVCAAGVA